MNILPVILCGGSGSRLWPLSRENDPKPFIRLDDGLSLIQHAYQRAIKVGNLGKVITVASQDLMFRVKTDFEELNFTEWQNDYILEPIAKNTAPAITMAALHAQSLYQDDVCLLVLAADHLIEDDHNFYQAVANSMELAMKDKLVTFGIRPDRVETGYGYISHQGSVVEKFVEKPTYDMATEYINNGNYLWNAGIFCFKPSVYLSELEKSNPEILTKSKTAYANINKNECSVNTSYQIKFSQDDFEKIPESSVDYAVMEHSDRIAVVPCGFKWSDVGSWDSLSLSLPKDECDNAIFGGSECIISNVHNSFLFSKEKLIVGVGLQDLVVVDTPDALLVANRNDSQEIKKIYQQLKSDGNECYKIHKTAHRPWGTYTILDEHDGYKVKRIVVYPQQRLSLQHHHYRSEHWIVVKGLAEVVNGEQTICLAENQSTYIKQGDIHRLVNIGEEPLVMIEVQYGDYLGEDDIVRHQDDYARI